MTTTRWHPKMVMTTTMMLRIMMLPKVMLTRMMTIDVKVVPHLLALSGEVEGRGEAVIQMQVGYIPIMLAC